MLALLSIIAALAATPWMPDAPRDHAVVWAAGDGAGGGPPAADVARLVARDHPHRFLYLGDVYSSGTASDYRDGYEPTYGPLAGITAPAPGNHEWPNRATGYRPYWKRVRGRTPPDWYSFRAGGWRVLVLNSETSRRRSQLAWLQRQLHARGTCRVAVIHRPRFSAGRYYPGERSVDPYWRALQGHARLVLSGHDHNMQRQRRRGTLTQFVSGAGGYGHYALRKPRSGVAFADDEHFGALRIDLRPGVARLAFVASDGATLDRSTARCRA